MSKYLEPDKFYYALVTEITLMHKVTGEKIQQKDIDWNCAYNPSFNKDAYDEKISIYKLPFFVEALHVFPEDADDFISIDNDLKYRNEDGYLPSDLEIDYLLGKSFDNDFEGDPYNDFEEIISLDEIEKAKASIKEYSERQDAMYDAWEAQQG